MRRALAKLFHWISRLCTVVVGLLILDCAILPLFTSYVTEDRAQHIEAGVFYFVVAVATEMLSAKLAETRRNPAGAAGGYRRGG
jgi:hypothetical protein